MDVFDQQGRVVLAVALSKVDPYQRGKSKAYETARLSTHEWQERRVLPRPRSGDNVVEPRFTADPRSAGGR